MPKEEKKKEKQRQTIEMTDKPNHNYNNLTEKQLHYMLEHALF